MIIDTKFIDNSKQVLDSIENAANEALKDSAEYLLKRSNLTVPFDTGQLRRSGKASVDTKRKQAAVSYDTDYAVRVHEKAQGATRNQKGRKVGSRNVRRYKWLERTAQEAVKDGKILQRMRRIFKKYL
jgi:hypothetical protein